MQKKTNIEETKSRLNIDNLEKEDKTKLFKKFVDSGGKVVDKNVDASLEQPLKKSTSNAPVGNHEIRNVELQNPFRSNDINTKSDNTNSEKSLPAEKTSKIQVFFRYINCVFAHIFSLNAKKFTNKFKEMTLKKVYNEFMIIKVLLDPIFKQSTLDSIKFREHLCSINLIVEYEMAYHIYNLLDMKDFQSLQTAMNISVDASEDSLKKCYSQLFLFQQYSTQMKHGTNVIIKQFIEINPERKDIHYDHQLLEQAFSTIWFLWYLSLGELMEYYWTRSNRKNLYQNFDVYLGIHNKSITIGLLAKEWLNQYKNKKTQPNENEEVQENVSTETSFPNDVVAKGVDFIINKVNFIEYYSTFKSGKDLRVLFQGNDRMFYLYAIVDYFDKEFNYLWTGDMVSFHIVPGGDTGRFDAKKELRALSTDINKCYELVNEYLRFVKTYKVQLGNFKRNSQHATQKQKEISYYSFEARKQIYNIYMKYYYLLNKIMETRNNEDSIIGNWDDVLSVKTGYRNQLFQNKNVEEAFQMVFEYVNAVCWFLKHSDLSGLEGKVSKFNVLPNDLINRK